MAPYIFIIRQNATWINFTKKKTPLFCFTIFNSSGCKHVLLYFPFSGFLLFGKTLQTQRYLSVPPATARDAADDCLGYTREFSVDLLSGPRPKPLLYYYYTRRDCLYNIIYTAHTRPDITVIIYTQTVWETIESEQTVS